MRKSIEEIMSEYSSMKWDPKEYEEWKSQEPIDYYQAAVREFHIRHGLPITIDTEAVVVGSKPLNEDRGAYRFSSNDHEQVQG